MLAFLLRRLVAAAVTILVASFVLFAAVILLPGDEVRAMFGVGAVDTELYESMLSQLHLDRPFMVQYWLFLKDFATLDFGTTMHGAPVLAAIRSSLPVSLWILAGVVAVQALLAPLLIVVAGLRPRSRLDDMSHAAAIALVSVPALVAAFVLQATFVYWSDIMTSPTWIRDGGWRNYVMPILALGVGAAAHLALVGREEILTTLAQPYVKVARAFGIRRGRVLRTHALRPASGPIVQLVGANVAGLITGLIVVEDVFAAPGLGNALLTAIRLQDRVLIVTMVMLIVIGVIVVSTLADLLHAWLDPRVRDRLF